MTVAELVQILSAADPKATARFALKNEDGHTSWAPVDTVEIYRPGDFEGIVNLAVHYDDFDLEWLREA